MKVFLVDFEVFGEFPDAFRENSNLNFGRPCVSLVRPELGNNCLFFVLLDHG